MMNLEQWESAAEGKLIKRQFTFQNFKEALKFVNQVGELAEAEGHHPDIHLINYKQVLLELTTHTSGGLSQKDFALAAKINQLSV